MDKLKGNGFIVMTFEGRPNEPVTVNNIVEIDFMDSGGSFYSVRQQIPIVNKIGTIINKHRIIEQYQFNLTGLAKQGFKVVLRKNQSGNKRKRLKRNNGAPCSDSSMSNGLKREQAHHQSIMALSGIISGELCL
jgi:hypothetical protein